MKNIAKYAVNTFLMLTLLFSLSCSATNYLSTSFSEIKTRLQSNIEELIVQKRVINFTEHTLDVLANKGEITKNDAQKAKNELDTIFVENFKKASLQQRLSYQIQRPFQFVYQKLTDPNATNLERFAYAAAVGVGVGITMFGLYQAGKYAQSKYQKPEKTKELKGTIIGTIIQSEEQQFEQNIINIGIPRTQEEIDNLYATKKTWEEINKLRHELKIRKLNWNKTSDSITDQLKDAEVILEELKELTPERKQQLLTSPATTIEVTISIPPQQPSEQPVAEEVTNETPQQEETWFQKAKSVLWDMVTGYIPKD
jgi:hypothetical protein